MLQLSCLKFCLLIVYCFDKSQTKLHPLSILHWGDFSEGNGEACVVGETSVKGIER